MKMALAIAIIFIMYVISDYFKIDLQTMLLTYITYNTIMLLLHQER